MPVWSVSRPSRIDGFMWIRIANPYWLVTVSGFQGSGAAGNSRSFPAVFPPSTSPILFRRRGRTLRIPLQPVNSFFRAICARCRRDTARRAQANRKRLPSPGGVSADGDRHLCRHGHLESIDSWSAVLFNNAPRIRSASKKRPSVDYQHDDQRATHNRADFMHMYIPAHARDERRLAPLGTSGPVQRSRAGRTAACPPARRVPRSPRDRRRRSRAHDGSPSILTAPWSIMRRPSPLDGTRPSSLSSAGRWTVVGQLNRDAHRPLRACRAA